MVAGIATSSIPVTTGCNFRLHPVVTRITKAISDAKVMPGLSAGFSYCRRNCAGEIAVAAARIGRRSWAADTGQRGDEHQFATAKN